VRTGVSAKTARFLIFMTLFGSNLDLFKKHFPCETPSEYRDLA